MQPDLIYSIPYNPPVPPGVIPEHRAKPWCDTLTLTKRFYIKFVVKCCTFIHCRIYEYSSFVKEVGLLWGIQQAIVALWCSVACLFLRLIFVSWSIGLSTWFCWSNHRDQYRKQASQSELFLECYRNDERNIIIVSFSAFLSSFLAIFFSIVFAILYCYPPQSQMLSSPGWLDPPTAGSGQWLVMKGLPGERRVSGTARIEEIQMEAELQEGCLA